MCFTRTYPFELFKTSILVSLCTIFVTYEKLDVLVAPKRVVEKFTDLSSDEVKDLFLVAQKVQKVIEQVHNTNSSSIVIQDGPYAGQTIKVRIFFNNLLS